MFSERTGWDRRANRLALAIARRHEAGLPIVDLTIGNPTQAAIPWPEDLRREILAGLAQPASLTYEPAAFGHPACRESVAAYYGARGASIDPDRVVLTASTSEAYASLFKLLADAGDEVLVPEPSYPLFDYLAGLESVRAVPYPLVWDGRWSIDLDAVVERASPRCRAVVAVAPNNPTGSYLSRPERAALDAFCADRALALVVDEVFADYRRAAFFADLVPTSVGLECRALTFCLSGLSKVAALPQMKLGWIVVQGDASLVAEALARLEIVLDAALSVGTPIQLAARAILPRTAELQAPIASRVAENGAALDALLRAHPSVTELPAEGGWYAVLRIPATRSEDDAVVALVEDDGIVVHPGYFFNFPSEAYVVISLLPPPPIFGDGAGRALGRLAGSGR